MQFGRYLSYSLNGEAFSYFDLDSLMSCGWRASVIEQLRIEPMKRPDALTQDLLRLLALRFISGSIFLNTLPKASMKELIVYRSLKLTEGQ